MILLSCNVNDIAEGILDDCVYSDIICVIRNLVVCSYVRTYCDVYSITIYIIMIILPLIY